MKHSIMIIALFLISISSIAQNNPYIQAVDEYVPAPGQFVNTLPEYEEGDDAVSMAQKCTELIADNAGEMVCLGAWGGYITFHFDHPIANVTGNMDLYISGNAISGNAEAGIVMVSQDTNGNGLPDDIWYELSGSADVDSMNTVYGYEITYSKSGDTLDIAWIDKFNNEGYVYRNAFHTQEYFPQWIESPMRFEGTLLPNNAYNTSGTGSYWILNAYRYGYVDNLPNSDTLGCSFNIDWAVDPKTRESVDLKYIDFVRVYTALNQYCGWIGETSTEITGAMDLHPDTTADIVKPIVELNQNENMYDLLGRKTKNINKGIVIKNHKIIIH